jgi:DNA-binding response OmpR family regulator
MISRLGLSLRSQSKDAASEKSPIHVSVTPPPAAPPPSPESALAMISNQWQSRSEVTPRPLNRKTAVAFEPNAVYRGILFRILQRAGLTVEFVQQSSEMQDAMDRLNPGCIFIDCDDPSQPGLALAQSIRFRGIDEERAVLIAVTGRTSREQRKARKLAGFDNYIAKPIRQEAVRALLARNSIGDGTTTAASLAIEQRTLSELAELLEYDANAIEQLYRQFLSTASDALSSMRRGLEDEDPHRIALQAQELRSASGQTGAVRMQDICVGIETLSQGGMLTGVEALIQDLSVAFEHVSRELFSPDFALRVREQEGLRYGAAGASQRRTALSPGKVLLAESDLLTSKFLAGALEGSGFTVVTTTSGRAAIEQATLQDFQVILLGTALPGIDGYGVLSQLRLMSNRVRTPVVLISSSGQEHEMLRAFDLGADEYVVKPLNPTEVVCRVRRFLR